LTFVDFRAQNRTVDVDELRERQDGVISHRQAIAAGMTESAIRHRLNSKRWQQLHRAVYATFDGPVSRRAIIWAALVGTSSPGSHGAP
jgi:hypothetical protein